MKYHWDTNWLNSVATYTEREDVSDADKRQILGQNPQTFYGFEC